MNCGKGGANPSWLFFFVKFRSDQSFDGGHGLLRLRTAGFDLDFIAKARAAIAAGLTVFYDSWW